MYTIPKQTTEINLKGTNLTINSKQLEQLNLIKEKLENHNKKNQSKEPNKL